MNSNVYALYRIKLAGAFSGLSPQKIWEAMQLGKVSKDDAISLLSTRTFSPDITRELENIALNQRSYSRTMSLPKGALEDMSKQPFNYGKLLKGVGIGGGALAGLGGLGALAYYANANRRDKKRKY